MLNRIRFFFWALDNHVCTIHRIPKTYHGSYDGGDYVCSLCAEERKKRLDWRERQRANQLDKWREEVGLAPLNLEKL